MNKLLLTLVGVAAFATLSTPAEARDRCHGSSYGSQRSYGDYQPGARVYVVQRPIYHRSYSRSYCAPPYRRVYYRSYEDDCDRRPHHSHHSHHHGIRGFIHRIFR